MGAICPKKKTSKARRDKRRAQTWKISMPNLAVCPKCSELMKAHRACRSCGTYNKKEVVKVG